MNSLVRMTALFSVSAASLRPSSHSACCVLSFFETAGPPALNCCRSHPDLVSDFGNEGENDAVVCPHAALAIRGQKAVNASKRISLEAKLGSLIDRRLLHA